MSKKPFETKPACRVPDCEKPAKTRGLCTTHYPAAMGSKSPATTRERLAQYLLPPKRGKNWPRKPHPPAGPDNDTPGEETRDPFDDLKTRGDKLAIYGLDHDTEVAAINAFAAKAGLKRLHFDAGTLFADRRGRKAIWLDRESGALQDAEILVGPSRRKIV